MYMWEADVFHSKFSQYCFTFPRFGAQRKAARQLGGARYELGEIVKQPDSWIISCVIYLNLCSFGWTRLTIQFAVTNVVLGSRISGGGNPPTV